MVLSPDECGVTGTKTQPDWSLYGEETWERRTGGWENDVACGPHLLPPSSPPFPPALFGGLNFILFFSFKRKRTYTEHFVYITKLPEESAVGKIRISPFFPLSYKISHGHLRKRGKNDILTTICFLSFWSSNLCNLQCWRICGETCSHLPLLPGRDCQPGVLATQSVPRLGSNQNIPAIPSAGWTVFCFHWLSLPWATPFSLWGQKKCPMTPPGPFCGVFYFRDALAWGTLCPDLVCFLFYLPFNCFPLM